MTKFRIVPIVTPEEVAFITQRKYFLFWVNLGIVEGSLAGDLVRVKCFTSPKLASKWIKERFGTSSYIVDYKA